MERFEVMSFALIRAESEPDGDDCGS